VPREAIPSVVAGSGIAEQALANRVEVDRPEQKLIFSTREGGRDDWND
jgi:hypothetical protein